MRTGRGSNQPLDPTVEAAAGQRQRWAAFIAAFGR